MKLRTRRIILATFIVLFLISAPILIFYSAGYRFDFQKGQILKIGNLYMDGKDLRDVEIYINQRLYPELFSKKIYITTLLPGRYFLTLKKDGYLDWQKEIQIEANLTTFVKNINLFKVPRPEAILSGQFEQISLSPDNQKIAYVKSLNNYNEVYLFSLNTQEEKLIYRSGQALSLGQWAPSSKRLLIKDFQNYYLIEIDQQNKILRLDFLPPQIDQFFWHHQNDYILLASNEHQFYKIDIVFKDYQQIYQEIYLENTLLPFFRLNQDNFYFIKNENNQINLYRYDMELDLPEKVTDLPRGYNYDFIDSPPNTITLLDAESENLIVIKAASESILNNDNSLEISTFKAKQAEWSGTIFEKLTPNYYLTFNNNNEIKKYNLNKNKAQLITRYGQPIKDLMVYKEDYLISLINGEVRILEIPEINNSRNQYEYLTDQGYIERIFMDQENNFYFISRKDSLKTLYLADLD